MLERDARRWTVACWLGYASLFVGFLLTGWIADLFFPEAWPDRATMATVDPAALPDWLDRGMFAEMYRANLLHHVLHLAVFGALIGWLQATALRGGAEGGDAARPGSTAPVGRSAWSLLAAAGFVSVLLLEALRPGLVAGGHPAPFEPILIAVGGGGLAGLLQWLYLRRRGIEGRRWLAFWVGGLVCGVIAAVIVLALVGPLLEPVARRLFDDETVWLLGQVIFFTTYGSVVGVVAGWISGRAITPLRSGAVEAAPVAV